MKLSNLLILATCLCLTSCTIAINLNNSEGTASDLVDETQSNTPNVSPTVSIPAKLLSNDDDEKVQTIYINKRQYPKMDRRKQPGICDSDKT
jgi:hypothetical protein